MKQDHPQKLNRKIFRLVHLVLRFAAGDAAADDSLSLPAVIAAAFSPRCFRLMWSRREAEFLKILSGQMGQGASGSPAPC